jgi:hypothetical protein
MSHHAHNRVRPWTVRPLGVRPQELFVLTTDEHRWTQIFRGLAKLYPSRRGGNHLARHFVGRPNGFIICVYPCPSVVEKSSVCTPEKPINSFHQNQRKPQQNPTPSTRVNPEFFGPPSRARRLPCRGWKNLPGASSLRGAPGERGCVPRGAGSAAARRFLKPC